MTEPYKHITEVERQARLSHLEQLPANRAEAEAYLKVWPAKAMAPLRLFWMAAENAKPGKRMELLRAMSGIKIDRFTQAKKRRDAMRKHFTFKEFDFPPDEPCFVCGGQWHHRHHVIQLQNRGGNSKSNVVPLCRRCHTQVHGRTF